MLYGQCLILDCISSSEVKAEVPVEEKPEDVESAATDVAVTSDIPCDSPLTSVTAVDSTAELQAHTDTVVCTKKHTDTFCLQKCLVCYFIL